MVEDGVGFLMKVALPEVHDQKGEVVENVPGRHRLIEFKRVEQDRLAAKQHDVVKVQVAVATAYLAASPTLHQRSPVVLEERSRRRRERFDSIGRKNDAFGERFFQVGERIPVRQVPEGRRLGSALSPVLPIA